MATTWSPARLEHARSVLGIMPSVEKAAHRLSDDWGESLTPSALRDALRRHGMGPARAMLKAPPMRVEELLEDVDEVTGSWMKPAHVETPRDTQIVGLLPDIHAPYHDEAALSIALNGLAHAGVSIVAQLGDLVDNHIVGGHGDIDPRHAKPYDVEIDSARRVRERIEALGCGRQIMLEGNHETRLMRYVLNKAPEIVGQLPTIRELLGFESPSWEWHPYGTSAKIGHLNLTHCIDGRAGPTEHMRARSDYESNVCLGHTHRAGIHYAGNARGESRVGAMLGWLGDKSAIKYVSQVKANRYWQHGFGLAYLEPDGNIHLHFVPIIDQRAVVHGKVIRP